MKKELNKLFYYTGVCNFHQTFYLEEAFNDVYLCHSDMHKSPFEVLIRLEGFSEDQAEGKHPGKQASLL